MYTPLCLDTARLNIRRLELEDAEFILALVNDPDWLRFIGDRRVSNLSDAKIYLEEGPRAMYRQYGFGLSRVALRDCDTPIGICGLLRRDSLPEVDLGYALLPAYRGQGYAFEAASAVLGYGFNELDQSRIGAIVHVQNRASIELLARLGFHYERQLPAEPDQDPTDLYIIHRKS